jgi:hypothetical protein
MDLKHLGGEAQKSVQEILGYLNLSSGAPDTRFLANLNSLFGLIENLSPIEGGDVPVWQQLAAVLREAVAQLAGTSEAFRHLHQAEAVLSLVFDVTLPAYRQFHRDLLFHQTDEQLFRPFFIGRVCEAVLQQGGPWNESDRIASGAIQQLNDYIGHRPVAVLRTEQKIQPYAHESVRPTPLYIRGAGVAVGRYQELIDKALAILGTADPTILFQSFFVAELLDELAVDPRAYDFDHPANKRPNYLFGQWDLHRLDLSGRSRRFVLQQVTLEAMWDRVENRGNLPYEEVLFEAAAVLAGTMLMGSGVSGNRPESHDSTVTLATLVQRIAAYRDLFYDQLLGQMQGAHAERLRAEAVSLRQAFGGVRQHFNQHLARRRAEQLQHVHLADVFGQMGATESALRQVAMVPVPSARMRCDIRCRLTTAHQAIEEGRHQHAAAMLPEIEDLLHRAIECGALVDPWNILGFGGQYSLFPSPENSVHDHRIDELIMLLSDIFALHMRLQKEAAAAGELALEQSISDRMEHLAEWWDKYAGHELGEIESISGQETKESADQVAAALRAWHEAGTAAGDLAFWRSHAEQFRSSKAYALVVEALLEHRDPVAAMALLVHWLSQAEEISLAEENYSFHELALLWMEDLWQPADAGDEEPAGDGGAAADRWKLAAKFLDYLEANAEEYWQVPEFALGGETPIDTKDDAGADEGDDLFGAAYEGVSYRDSTDDGFEGDIFETGADNPTDFELVLEGERIVHRLAFLGTVAQLWKLAAVASLGEGASLAGRDDVLAGWLQQAATNRQRLIDLLMTVECYRIPPPRGTHESLVEYDRRRAVKETLLEQIITTCVETIDAGRMMVAAMEGKHPAIGHEAWEESLVRVLRAVLRGDAAGVRAVWRSLMAVLRKLPLLYVALAKGGSPLRIVNSRSMQCVLRRLLAYLPRLGMLRETCQLLQTIQAMETEHPVGPGAVTEFDQDFEIGCKAIVRCLVVSSERWHKGNSAGATGESDVDLIACLEQITEVLLRSWLAHSRGVRLSALETLDDRYRWSELKQFIERYGADIFTQRFMNLGNLRGILHEGVDAYLESLENEPGAEEEFRLLTDLRGPLHREEAVHWLGLAIEAVVENYSQYIDYNSTTTQSDRGEMLYTFLDFLRLLANYNRVAWNLQPVLLAHEVMVRCGRDDAAEIWRNAVAQRTRSMAADLLKRLTRLNKKYGMRLPSVSDRLGERFVRPLRVDRLRALVSPAMEELRNGETAVALARLEEGITEFTEKPSGSGFDVPSWLQALEAEVDDVSASDAQDLEMVDPLLELPQVRLSLKETEQQLRRLVKTDE